MALAPSLRPLGSFPLAPPLPQVGIRMLRFVEAERESDRLWMMRVLNLTAFSAGLAAGITVTRRLHSDPAAGKWGERIGTTRFRFANLPVGGTIAIGASVLLPHPLEKPVRALGTGALLGAVGWGLADPLPADVVQSQAR